MKQQNVRSRVVHSFWVQVWTLLVLIGGSATGRANFSMQQEGFGAPPQSQIPKTWSDGLSGIANTNFRTCVVGQAMGLAELLGENAASGQCSMAARVSFDINTECAPGGEAQEAASCESFKMRDGTFDVARFEGYLRSLESQHAALCCQTAKMTALNRELECVQSQASALYSQINSLGEIYNRDFTAAETWNNQVFARIEDRKKQVGIIDEKLNGGKAGDPGLRAVAAQVAEVVNQIPTSLKNARDGQRSLVVQKRQFEEIQATTLAASAKSCFKDATEGLQCVDGGPTLSFQDYLLCRVQNAEEARFGARPSQADQARAQASRSRLQAILNAVLGEMPESGSPAMASDPAGQAAAAQAFSQQGRSVLTYAQFERRVGRALSRIQVPGFDVQGKALEAMQVCFNRGQQEVAQGLSEKTSPLGLQVERIQQAERDIKAQLDTSLNQVKEVWETAQNTFTGRPVVLPIDACLNAEIGGKIDCYEKVSTNLRRFYEGTTPTDSSPKITIVGNSNNQDTSFSLPCTGLKTCIREMETARNNLTQHVEQMERQRAERVQAFNTAVTNFNQKVANQLSGQNEYLTKRMQAINAAMRKLGISGGIAVPTVQGETLQAGQNGLFNRPQNLMSVIGGGMNPPLIDFSNMETMSEGFDRVAERSSDLATQLSRSGAALTTARGLPNSCSREILAEEIGTLREQIGGLQNCHYSRDACGGGANSEIAQLEASLRSAADALDAGGFNGSTLGVLETGARNACADFSEEQDVLREQCNSPAFRNAKRDKADHCPNVGARDETVARNAQNICEEANATIRRIDPDDQCPLLLVDRPASTCEVSDALATAERITGIVEGAGDAVRAD